MSGVELATVLGVILGPAGAAYVGVKVSLNGTRERVKRIEDKLDKIVEGNTSEHVSLRERITRLEAHIE